MDDLLCFIGLKAFIEKDGKLLILHDPQMGLDLPGGKIQKHETDIAASLQREVREETGLEINVGQPFSAWIFTIPLDSGHRSAGKKIFTVGYRCKYISGEIYLSNEHDWYKWVNVKSYKDLPQSNFSSAIGMFFTL